MLDPTMTVAWMNVGEEWSVVTSRIVTARLKLEQQRVTKSTRQANNTGTAVYVTIVSMYAPTHGTTQEKKEEFYDDLKTALDSVHKDDALLKSHYHSDRQRYVAQRRAVAKEVKQAKNTWFQKKAWEMKREIMKGTSEGGVWQGLREIQRGRAGLQPVRQTAIRNGDGQLWVDEEESLQCGGTIMRQF